jgi:hypothetical protein
VGFGVRCGKAYQEAGTLFGGQKFDGGAEFEEGFPGDVESQPSTALVETGGKKGFKNFGVKFRGDPGAGVLKKEMDFTGVDGELDMEGSLTFHGLVGIEDEVGEDLDKTDGLRKNGGKLGREPPLDFNGAAFVANKGQTATKEVLDIEVFRFAGSAEKSFEPGLAKNIEKELDLFPEDGVGVCFREGKILKFGADIENGFAQVVEKIGGELAGERKAFETGEFPADCGEFHGGGTESLMLGLELAGEDEEGYSKEKEEGYEDRPDGKEGGLIDAKMEKS